MEIPFDLYATDGRRIDTTSDTWLFIHDYMQQQRNILLNQLCKSGLDIAQTEFLRGQLALIEKLFKLSRQTAYLQEDTPSLSDNHRHP